MFVNRVKAKIKALKKKKQIDLLNKEKNCRFSYGTTLNEGTIIEGYSHGLNSVFINDAFIGKGTYFGSNVHLERAKIGRYTSIGNNIRVVRFVHPTDYVSTYPSLYCCNTESLLKFSHDIFKGESTTVNGFSCEIGNDVWIGDDVLIKGGVKIGDGSVIGMGAVVTKDVPPYSIAVGVPAKVIKYRFSEEIVEKLKMIKWWYWDINLIDERINDFKNTEFFANKYFEVKK